MKNIITVTFLFIMLSNCKAQTYPLRTYSPRPENSYLKDTNNELQHYVGTWKGEWNGKIVYIYINKMDHVYKSFIKEYRDILIGRFKTTDLNGNVLFDNTNLSDDDVKIRGTRFRKQDDKYDFNYIDIDLCNRGGTILINFTDTTKTKLEWKYSQSENFIFQDCWYFGATPANTPQPLPNNIVLVKQ